MQEPEPKAPLRLALPKGRMQEGVRNLLAEAGVDVRSGARGYRPSVSLAACEAKLLKPQSVALLLHQGSRDVGFLGADWVAELELDLVQVLDTGLDPVRIVAAAPPGLLRDGELPRCGKDGAPLRIATEYARLTSAWIAGRELRAEVVRTHGATEVFPPEDADAVVDNTATGATLAANGLVECDELLRSSTRMMASRAAWEDPARRARIEDLALLLGAVIEARTRVMVELNVAPACLEPVVAVLPCMRRPTVSNLAGAEGFAVKAAVPRSSLATLIPELRARGGSDIVVTPLGQIVP